VNQKTFVSISLRMLLYSLDNIFEKISKNCLKKFCYFEYCTGYLYKKNIPYYYENIVQ